MNSLLWIFVAFCGLAYVFNRFATADNRVAATPEQRRYDFIVDVCDGDRRKAARLVEEKCALFPHLNGLQAQQLVYQDMLDLTAEERAAAHVAIRRTSRKAMTEETAA
ncbi:hypothetical protein [Herbaspirillum hiltneri]|uniref:hypothetical protein n=1 Tax=Herbaspirillum hiltneri TaxID=341045 RepID=UPI00069CD766|nr:hypothetical protein [Herbaspirillum hiltneri]